MASSVFDIINHIDNERFALGVILGVLRYKSSMTDRHK
jgi:hypothetical protein